MTILEHIAAKYPNAIKALPKGWRFLEFGERLCKNDKVISVANNIVPVKKLFAGLEYDVSFYPIIRRDRKKKAVDSLPGLTWPSIVKKEGEVKDAIFVGRGDGGGIGIEGLYGHKAFACFVSNGAYYHSSSFFEGTDYNRFYFVPKDHPMLAKYKSKSNSNKELIAQLTAENKALKERLAKFENAAKELAKI